MIRCVVCLSTQVNSSTKRSEFKATTSGTVLSGRDTPVSGKSSFTARTRRVNSPSDIATAQTAHSRPPYVSPSALRAMVPGAKTSASKITTASEALARPSTATSASARPPQKPNSSRSLAPARLCRCEACLMPRPSLLCMANSAASPKARGSRHIPRRLRIAVGAAGVGWRAWHVREHPEPDGFHLRGGFRELHLNLCPYVTVRNPRSHADSLRLSRAER